MLVFNNQQCSGYEEIASYSPRYYRSIKEMDAVFRLAGWLIDLMAADMENMVAFQFLKYMDDEALSRYETFLGIVKDSDKTLDDRKAYVSATLIGAGKLSSDMLVTMVNQFGECDCEVTLTGNVLKVSVCFKDNNDKYMRDIMNLVLAKGPAHLRYQFNQKFCYAVTDKNALLTHGPRLKIVCLGFRVPFFPFRSYNGLRRYDGSSRYDAKRRYELGTRLVLHYKIGEVENKICGLTVETRRNVQYYNGRKRFDGTTKYNAILRKEVIE